ncbi:MAG TPA: hypothetical protein VH877_07245 [Polyangia bacterium]|jgi:hypothetical protein|nr:hypothetical protein [Polyangia bacterium]
MPQRSSSFPAPPWASLRPRATPAALCCLLFFLARPALAQPACDDSAQLPNPVYLAVGDTQVNLLKRLGKELRDRENVTLVWRASGSCTNLDALYGDVKLTGTLSYIPQGYDPATTPTPPTCTTPAGGVSVDIANSIVFTGTCPSSRPPTIVDQPGPVQSFVFVVPRASSQRVITAEEAYFAFGFGQAGGVEPWTDESQLYTRPPTKGTVISVGASIRVPAGKWKGQAIDMSKDLASLVAQSPAPERALGILGSEVFDTYRTTLRQLAFRAFGQYHAYYPDSTENAQDKRNVRDGHYHIWSYTRWLLPTDGAGNALKPLAARVVSLIVGSPVAPPPAFEPLDAEIEVGLVPRCAMRVARTSEGGDFTLDAPVAPCGCYFESRTGGTSCTACTSDSTCGGGRCRHGYCEAR